MVSSRSTNKYAEMMDCQFKELLVIIMAVMDPVKPAANSVRNPGQASIENAIYYSTATGINIWQ